MRCASRIIRAARFQENRRGDHSYLETPRKNHWNKFRRIQNDHSNLLDNASLRAYKINASILLRDKKCLQSQFVLTATLFRKRKSVVLSEVYISIYMENALWHFYINPFITCLYEKFNYSRTPLFRTRLIRIFTPMFSLC